MNQLSATRDPRRGRHLPDLLILLTGGGFVAGVVLLSVAVWAELPGPLAAYGDPEASWPIAVQVVLGSLAFGTWRWVNRRKTRPFTVVLLALGIAVVVALATSSYARCPDVGQSAGWSVATRVIGLITNNYEFAMFEAPGCELAGPPPALQFARLTQLVVLLVAATSAVLALLRTQMDRIAVRFAPRVALVVGVDEAASALLPALATGAGRLTRAVLTPDPLAPWVGRARAAGWRVVIGDPENDGLLRALLLRGRWRAVRSLAVLAPDSTAAQRLVAAVEQAVEGSRGRDPVRALLRMDDAWQAEDWRRRYLGRTETWIVDTISENEVTARLLAEDVLQRGADQLLVSGHSDLTFALAAEVAQHARERAVVGEGPVVPPVVLVDPHAQDVLDEHALAQARFGNAVPVDIAVEPGRRLADVVAEAVVEHRQPALLFTGGVDVADQRLAARLGATYPDLLVYSRRTEVAGLGTVPLMAEVRAFGTTLDAGGGRPIDSWERIARRIHERFIREYPDPTRASRRPWDELPPIYRESNVRQVLTVMGSAVAIGRSWGASGAEATPPTDEQLDQMAQAEQRSWQAHFERHGWRYGEIRSDEAKTHPDLLPWAKLSEESREKTRDGVRTALDLLATLGYRSFDDPALRWRRYRRIGEVRAVQRKEPWSWTTADGTKLRGGAGDWEVSDAGGSRSVRHDIFEVTHEHLDGDRWRRVGEVEARRAVPGELVRTLEGEDVARHDQWVVRGQLGEEWLVSSAHLQATYVPVED